MAPIIDRLFQRRVSLVFLGRTAAKPGGSDHAFTGVRDYQLSLAALLNLAAYLTGYAVRLPCMTQLSKTGQREATLGYFVEEQLVAMPVLVLAPGLFALVGHGTIASAMRFGFSNILNTPFTISGLAIGFFYAGLGLFLAFIYLDRRENTFCNSLFRLLKLLAGIAASYILTWWLHAPYPAGSS